MVFDRAAHTLPVVGVWCGTGVAATVGLDRCCHLWSLATGAPPYPTLSLPYAFRHVCCVPERGHQATVPASACI